MFCTIIALVVLVLLSVGVYAYTTNGSGVPSNMGHSADEVGGAIVEARTTDPASPAVGEMWLRTDIP